MDTAASNIAVIFLCSLYVIWNFINAYLFGRPGPLKITLRRKP